MPATTYETHIRCMNFRCDKFMTWYTKELGLKKCPICHQKLRTKSHAVKQHRREYMERKLMVVRY